jgi:dihydropteroate synthase
MVIDHASMKCDHQQDFIEVGGSSAVKGPQKTEKLETLT